MSCIGSNMFMFICVLFCVDPGENKKSIKGHRDFRKSREQRDRDILSFEKIRVGETVFV